MSELKTDGYVVCKVPSRPLTLITQAFAMPKLPEGGVLMYSSVATVFETEAEAQKAIDRTLTYGHEHHNRPNSEWLREMIILPVAFASRE